jgi:hypothetical protein
MLGWRQFGSAKLLTLQGRQQNCGEMPRNPFAEKFIDGSIFYFYIDNFTYRAWIKYVF